MTCTQSHLPERVHDLYKMQMENNGTPALYPAAPILNETAPHSYFIKVIPEHNNGIEGIQYSEPMQPEDLVTAFKDLMETADSTSGKNECVGILIVDESREIMLAEPSFWF